MGFPKAQKTGSQELRSYHSCGESEHYYFDKPKTTMRTKPLAKPNENYRGKFSQADNPEAFSSLRARLLRANTKFKNTTGHVAL